jgi:outer membrane protein assembly factor BamE (lipoprotein component of BamABCDE complex)
MRIMPSVVAPLAVILFCHGDLRRAEAAGTAKPSIIGMTKEQVLACMGPPNQRVTAGAMELWRYVSLSTKGGVTVRDCTVSVTFSEGHLTALQSEGLLTPDAQCAQTIQNCAP